MSEAPTGYELLPCYPAVGEAVVRGWDAAVRSLPTGPTALAVDGPHVLNWAALVAGLSLAVTEVLGTAFETRDVRDDFAPWSDILARTSSPVLRDDPDFETIPDCDLRVCFDTIPILPRPQRGLLVVYGPGAALLEHDVLWYADLPKRYAEAAVTAGTVTNLGQRAGDGPASTKRLFYVDWPLLDQHRDSVAGDIRRWVDTQDDPDSPTSLSGESLRRTMTTLSEQPVRTRPTFNTTSWGGHWAQRELGMNPHERNTALGYELIAPESGILVGEPGGRVEIPFQLLVAQHPRRVMGAHAHQSFGTSFPVRFDYLDTVDGGNLSVHCHPQERYMREVFGWPYTQHETYYLMVGGGTAPCSWGRAVTWTSSSSRRRRTRRRNTRSVRHRAPRAGVSGGAARALRHPRRHAARKRRRQRRPRGERHAVPVLAPVLRLAPPGR